MPNLTTILGIVILLLLGATGLEYHLNKVHKAEAASAEAQVAGLIAANKSKDDVIQQYAIANQRIADFAKQQQEAATQANAAADAAVAALQQSHKHLTELESTDRSRPACTQFEQTDISAICPAHADAMRQRASR